jgi:PAS domain S-box-containing protein
MSPPNKIARQSILTAAIGPDAQEQPKREQKVKILLVDDTPENLVSLEAALDGLNQDLVLAHSGKQALLQLLEHDFAAILLDVKMPDMDGFEAAELIRRRERSRHTPILFLTGYKNEEHLFRGYDLGAVDFLFKPIVPEVLRSKVAVFVELSRNAALLREQAAALRHQADVLRRAEQTFRSLLEAAPEAMVMCRQDGQIVMANSRVESLFGASCANLIGINIRTLIPDWDFAILPAPDEDLSKAVLHPFDTAEMRAVQSDGRSFPAEISLSPLKTQDGVLITNAIRDITERKRAEEQIRELNSHLEKRIIERTEALLRSNEELQQFAYVASHDLQEPLRTVSLYTQLLAKRYGKENNRDADELIATIIDNAKRMEQLIRGLLDFSRLDAEASERFKPTDCNAAVQQAIRNLETSITHNAATISCDALPSVRGDFIQLTQLFQNLLGNSIRYRSDEAPRIHISASAQEAEWLFSIEDNGIGIEPQYADKVFGIFKRLHGREKYAGSGMGLAICKKIVTRHGGRIWVDISFIRGACLRFTLPRPPN